MLYIIGLIISGLIVGALGRLAIPGPNPMSIPKTILIGIGGSFLGGLVGALIFRDDNPLGLVLAVAGAAGIIWFLERNAARTGGAGYR